jgi:hypothetical protein
MTCIADSLLSHTKTPNSELCHPVRWYAVYIYPRYKKSFADNLVPKSIEGFLPAVVTERQWKDRKVQVESPLFFH